MSDSDDSTLSKDEIEALLRELGEDLAKEDVKASLFVVGGAAMALAFNTRRMTADVDGVFEPKTIIYAAARRVAARHEGLPEDWLNDGVKGLLPGNDPDQRVVLEGPGITVSVPSPRYLLALKVQAARIDRDSDDIRVLARACNARTSDDVLAIAEAVIGKNRLPPKSQFIVEELFADAEPEPEPVGESGSLGSRFASIRARVSRWAEERREAAANRPAKPPRPAREPRCSGYTQAGRRCVYRAGHGGRHRGRW